MNPRELKNRLRNLRNQEMVDSNHSTVLAGLELDKVIQERKEKKIAYQEFDPNDVCSRKLSAYANDDNIYYNIYISNKGDQAIPAFSQVRKDQAIIDNPTHYYLSVVRFDLPGQAIPIFIFNANTYYVTLVDTLGIDHTTTLILQPNAIVIQPIVGSVYQYQQMLDMINVALQTSFTACGVNVPVGMTDAPYMTFERTTGFFSLWTQQEYDPAIGGANTVQIWFNSKLYYLFDNFLTIFAGEGNANFKDYQFKIENYFNNVPAAPANYYQFEQEFNSIFNWQDVQTISFRTTIPVRNEFTPNGAVDTGLVGSEQIFIDFEPVSTTDAGAFRGYFQFYRTDNYRLIDILSDAPLTEFTLDVFWKDHLNTSYPVYIPPGTTLTLKLLFVKKDLYKSKYFDGGK